MWTCKRVFMTDISISCALAIFAVLHAGTTCAQTATAPIMPANPTSADSIVLIMSEGSCGGLRPYLANPYRVTMLQNHITVTQGERKFSIAPTCPGTNIAWEEADIGRLPPGNYTISVVTAGSTSSPSRTLTDNAPFTVTDARLAKSAPYVRRNYAGGWYDPNDAGWGLFIAQDAFDNIVATWFTYTRDGKGAWYSYQPLPPKWASEYKTLTDDFYLLSRPPGTTSPPAPPSTGVTAGTASIDFTPVFESDNRVRFNIARFTYRLHGEQAQTRTLTRFLQ